jgi:hypothetical protein
VDSRWDTVDPDKQTAQPAFGKRVTQPKPLYLPTVSYPRRLLHGTAEGGVLEGG